MSPPYGGVFFNAKPQFPISPHSRRAQKGVPFSRYALCVTCNMELQHDEGAAAGSNFQSACFHGFAAQAGQFVVLTQSQFLAV